MAMRKMTMQQVREFLNKNNFGYITSIAGENVIEHIEAMVYPPSKMSVHFFVHQSDEERAEEADENDVGVRKFILQTRSIDSTSN